MIDNTISAESLSGRRVPVMGLGVHGGGVGVTRYLVRQGARVTVTDHAAPHLLEASLRKLDNLPIRFVLGSHEVEDYRSCDLIIRNPAVPDSSPYLASARQWGIPVDSEIGLFWRVCPSRRIIGVTGTKGKTTTTRLIGAILRQAGLNSLVAGNLGVSGLDALDTIRPDSWVVLELSCFQLQSLAPMRPRPRIAVLTSLYPDHIDRYQSYQHYRDAKATLFNFQEADDVTIVNGTSLDCRELAGGLRSRVRSFDSTVLPADWSLSLVGEHNRALAGAAWLAVEAAGISPGVARETIRGFPAVAGRLEFVAEINGVRFYNDAAACIPEASAEALRALDRDVIWIAGGYDDGGDYSAVTQVDLQHVRAVVLLPGTARDRIIDCLPSLTIVCASSLEQAILRASKLAQPGDTVLYSPASGRGLYTLDRRGRGQYRHEDEPPHRFRDAVLALAATATG